MATNGADREAGPDSEPKPGKSQGRGRYARLKFSIGRHPADLVRMAIAAGVVIGCRFIAMSPGVNPVESAIASQIERLPEWLTPVWEVMTWLGWWPGIAVAAAAALYAGRMRMGAFLAFSGAASWLLAIVVQWSLAPRMVPLALGSTLARSPGTDGFHFPDARTAVIATLATVAAPYVGRFARNGSWVLVVLVATADVFLGRNLPLGVFAGAVLGWGTGAFFHVILGAPGRRTTESAVHLALEQAGLAGTRILSVQTRLLRPQVYDLATPDGERLQMKIVRRLHRRAGPAFKLRRALASLDVMNDARLSTPRHEVEHEAYITLLAERAGVGTLPVILAGEIEHGPPFLIQHHVDGRPLSSLSPDEISEAMLDEIWGAVLTLGRAHIRHQDLRAQNVLIDTEGRPHIIDFTFSRVGGPVDQYWQDTAEMLVTIAAVVGVERAVASVRRSLPLSMLHGALRHVQPLALHRRLRRQLAARRPTLVNLRATLAEQIDAPVPSFRLPVRPGTIIVLLLGGLAVYLLLPQLSSLDNVLVLLGRGNRVWFAITVVIGFLAIVASAISIVGSSPRGLPIGKTIAVQLAAAFTGRTTAAGIGFYRINYVFLERIGLGRGHAVAVVALNRIVTGLVNAVATIIGIVVIGAAVPFDLGAISAHWLIIVLAAALLVAIVSFLATPYGRRRFTRPGIARVRGIGRDLLPTLRDPFRATQLVGGCIAYLLLSAVGLVTTLAAFRPDVALIPVLAVFVVGSTLGQLAPTPGGLGAVEAAMIAGLTAIGMSAGDSVAAVLISRVLTYWLPILPGIVTFRILQHYDVI